MKVGRFVLALTAVSAAFALAQDIQAQSPHHRSTSDQRPQTSAFVKGVRESTARFRDVAVAEGEGYALMFGCVSGPDSGAMGLHYVNLPLVVDGVLDPARPEIVIYEPLPSGGCGSSAPTT
ncbi:MAG TPA: hypothetical protein VI485_15845 [Vicinamibacterales bacterium]|nr:hypothetical protein [Vicinamibacterales bacterium]